VEKTQSAAPPIKNVVSIAPMQSIMKINESGITPTKKIRHKARRKMDPLRNNPVYSDTSPLIDADEEASMEGMDAQESDSTSDASAMDIDGSQQSVPEVRRCDLYRKEVKAEKTPFDDLEPDDFLTDAEIERMKVNKVGADALKQCRRIIREKNFKTRQLERDLREARLALARQTGQQASQNEIQNAKNRVDFVTLDRENVSNSVMKIGSFVLSVIMAVLTIICIVI
jgi:hypothetical protein